MKQQIQEAGPPDSLISDLLGHAGPGQTNRTYDEAATVDRMAEWIDTGEASASEPRGRVAGKNDKPWSLALEFTYHFAF